MAILNIKNLPDELHQRLKQRASHSHRSVSQEVIHILTQSLAVHPGHSLLELRGLGKDVWEGIDPARHIQEERDSWE